MKQKLHTDSRGVAHVALIAVAVLVLAAVGFAGYRIMNKDKTADSATNNAIQEAAKEECKKIDDEDLCKFFSSWEASKKYRMTSTSGGSKSTFEVDGNKSRVVVASSDTPYEVITIDKTTYTKAGNVWYKQTIKSSEQDIASSYDVDFDEPTDEETTEDKTTYKKLGKEACGNLTCFKYEAVDPKEKDNKQFIWFDDKDYKLRRTTYQDENGTTEMTFEYDNVTVSEPSPVKELGPNQYIVPGQSEPVAIPTGGDGL